MPKAKSRKTAAQLKELLQLEPNWDTYGALAIDPKYVAAALKFILTIVPDAAPAPAVVPTSRGGVQLEWYMTGLVLEIEFLCETHIRGLFVDRLDGGRSWELEARLVE